MSQSVPPPVQTKAVAPQIRTLALALALASLLPCASALAMGSLPWQLPDQQQNASAAANASITEVPASDAPGPAATPLAEPVMPPAATTSDTAVATPLADPAVEPASEPVDAEGQAQFAVLRQYFRRQLTLAGDFPEVFSRRVKDGETLAFLSMCEMQRRRGLLDRFRSAEVDISGLRFTRVTSDPDLARIRVTGRYSFTLRPKAPAADGPRASGVDGSKVPVQEDAKAPTAAEAAANATAQASVHEILEEDALFVLLPEQGEWKIYERREGWRP